MLSSLPTRCGLRTITWVPHAVQLPQLITAGYWLPKNKAREFYRQVKGQ